MVEDPHLKRYICISCKDDLDTSYDFKLKCDKLNYSSKILCETCGTILRNTELLKEHMDQHEQEISQSKKDQALNKIFSERRKVAHPPKEPVQKEVNANKSSTHPPKEPVPKKDDKSNHKRSHKKTSKNEPEPKKRKTRTDSLDFERKLFDFRCRKCNLTFLNISGLKTHLAWHDLKKEQFKCPRCRLIFLKEIQMKKHIMQDHWPNDE